MTPGSGQVRLVRCLAVVLLACVGAGPVPTSAREVPGAATPPVQSMHGGAVPGARTFATPACAAPGVAASPPAPFGVAALERLLDDSRRSGVAGFIYVWSPHMPLSVLGLREAVVLAGELDIRLEPLLDPDADPRLVADALADCDVPPTAARRLASDALARRSLLNHFPGLLAFADGALLGAGWLGYHPPPVVRRFLGERLR